MRSAPAIGGAVVRGDSAGSARLSVLHARFEINVRSATILGIIGAGRIGKPLIFAQSLRDWDRVGVIMLGVIVIVTLFVLIAGVIRRKMT